MVIVDCPWCFGPVFLHDGDDVLECDGCSARAEIAPDERPSEMARAA